MEPLLSNFCESRLFIIFLNVKGHGFSLASESTEVYLTAAIQGTVADVQKLPRNFQKWLDNLLDPCTGVYRILP